MLCFRSAKIAFQIKRLETFRTAGRYRYWLEGNGEYGTISLEQFSLLKDL